MTQLAYVRIGIDRVLDLPDGQFVIGIASEDELEASADVVDIRRIDVKADKRIKHGPRGRRLRAKGPERTVVTVIRAATPLGREAAGTAMKQWKDDRDQRESWTAAAIAVVNTALAAHRVAWRDPYATEITTEDLWLARLGVASADVLASGGAGDELDVLPSRRVRDDASSRAKPGEIISAALSGSLEIFEGEQLLAFATREINHDRMRSAAGAVRAASEVLAAELPADGPRTAVAEALAGDGPWAAADLLDAIEDAQDALDRWRDPVEEFVSHQTMRLPTDETDPR